MLRYIVRWGAARIDSIESGKGGGREASGEWGMTELSGKLERIGVRGVIATDRVVRQRSKRVLGI